jgi:hypothetical protein
MRPNDERGMALILALLMTLMVSALGAAMVHVAVTETQSSASYTSMSQARYAAESGVAAAAHYLLSSDYEAVMPGTATDALANYVITASPITAGGNPVVLSSDPAVDSNYPVADVVTAFAEATTGTLGVGNGSVNFTARARLLGMRTLNDSLSGLTHTLQVWEVTGIGRRADANVGEVEVSAIIDRTTRPVFSYGAFATGNGCNAMTFSGNATTSSYDSSVAVAAGATPVLTTSGGHVGTNGNLGQTGNAQVNGTLSTPMAGIGACTANNVTAATLGSESSVSEGLVQLPQPVTFPTPAAPNPLPPTGNVNVNGNNCSGLPNCTMVNSKPTITPTNAATPVLLGNVTVNGNADLVLKAGTYHVNSLTINGGGKIIVDSSTGGQVKIIVAGQGSGTTAIDIEGNGFANSTWDPNLLRIEYAGEKIVKMAGNGNTSAIIYAPNAAGQFSGNADFYGAVITRTINSTGNMGIHYDRRLEQSSITLGNPVMTTFTWRTF